MSVEKSLIMKMNREGAITNQRAVSLMRAFARRDDGYGVSDEAITSELMISERELVEFKATYYGIEIFNAQAVDVDVFQIQRADSGFYRRFGCAPVAVKDGVTHVLVVDYNNAVAEGLKGKYGRHIAYQVSARQLQQYLDRGLGGQRLGASSSGGFSAGLVKGRATRAGDVLS